MSDVVEILTDGQVSLEITSNAVEAVDVVSVGPAGPGVPTGGIANQVLIKSSSADYHTEWHSPVKADVGLGNADNTSDADKPVSTAAQAALNTKEPNIAAGTTAQYWRGDKSWQDMNTAIRAAISGTGSISYNAATGAFSYTAPTKVSQLANDTGYITAAGTATNVSGVVAGANGGTGINNAGKAITLGGNLTTSGAFASTFTMTGVTTVTFPTSGTLLSTAAAVTVAQGGTGATTAAAALTALGAEAAVAAGTTAQYRRGDKSWADFATDVRAAVLTGLSTATNAAVAATDSLLAGLGKLQAQITDLYSSKAPLASPSFTGNVSVAKTISFGSEYDNGNAGAAATITLSNGQNQKVTLTANTTLTISAVGVGIGHYQLRILQDGTGSRTAAFTGLSASRWLGSAAAPTINAAANGETIVNLFYDGANFTQSMSKVGAA